MKRWLSTLLVICMAWTILIPAALAEAIPVAEDVAELLPMESAVLEEVEALESKSVTDMEAAAQAAFSESIALEDTEGEPVTDAAQAENEAGADTGETEDENFTDVEVKAEDKPVTDVTEAENEANVDTEETEGESVTDVETEAEDEPVTDVAEAENEASVDIGETGDEAVTDVEAETRETAEAVFRESVAVEDAEEREAEEIESITDAEETLEEIPIESVMDIKTDNDETISEEVVEDFSEVAELLAANLSSGVQNIVARARQQTQIEWIPVKNVKGYRNSNGALSITYEKGKTYKGIPYGQPVNAGKYVPDQASFSTFLSAVRNGNSLFYTSRGRRYANSNNMSSTYYASDCSAFVSYAYGLKRMTTASIASSSLFTRVSGNSVYNAQVGDCFNKSGSHVVLITGLVYNGSTLTKVEISEQTPPQAKVTMRTPAYVQSNYADKGYTLLRYKNRNSVSAPPPLFNVSTSTPTPTPTPTTIRLTLNASGTTTANANVGAGKQVYFSFTPSASGRYTFRSTNVGGDPYAYLYSSNRTTQLTSDDDGAGNRNFLITYDLSAGTTYYYGVKWYSSSASGTIYVQLSRQAPTPTPTPTTIRLTLNASGTTTASANVSAGKQVYFSFTPSASGRYTFRSTNASGDPYAYLYGSNRTTQLTSDDDGAGNRNFLITYDLYAGTTYYYGVKWYSSSASGTIYVQLSRQAPTPTPIPAPSNCFPRCSSSCTTITAGLNNIGVDSSYNYRKQIAAANNISNYTGTASQNNTMLSMLKSGTLKRPGSGVQYFRACSSSCTTITTGLNNIGVDSSYNYRKQIAAANNISNYTGTAAQNNTMLAKLKAGNLVKP